MNEYPPVNNFDTQPPQGSYWRAAIGGVVTLALLAAAGGAAYYFVLKKEAADISNESAEVSSPVDTTSSVTPSGSSDVTYSPTDIYVVGVDESISLEAATEVVRQAGGIPQYELPLSHALVITLQEHKKPLLEQQAGILWVEESQTLTPTQLSTVEALFDFVPTAYAASPNASGVDVFILDSGAGKDIPYASTYGVNSLNNQLTFVKGAGAADSMGHGTQVATAFFETFTALDDTTYPVRLHSIKVSNTNEADTQNLAEAVRAAVGEGAEVINLSYSSQAPSSVIDKAIEYATKKGVLVTVSAGNSADVTSNYLTSNPDVVVVGALNSQGTTAEYSSGFKDGSVADVFAFGDVTVGNLKYQGTSFAAPRVSAVLAAILASPIDQTYDKNKDGVWNIDEAKARLGEDIAKGKYALMRNNIGKSMLLQPLSVQANSGPVATESPMQLVPQSVTSSLPPEVEQAVRNCMFDQLDNQGKTPDQATDFCSAEDNYEQYAAKTTPVAQSPSLNSRGPQYYDAPVVQANTVVAQTPSNSNNSETQPTGGIVPCDGLSCDLCQLGQLMQNIINFLIGFALLIAVAMFAYAGFLYVTGGTSETKITRAHKIFRDVLIGFLIAISAWLVVQTFISVVFDGDFFIGGNWNELQCTEGRLMDAKLGDLLREVIPGVKAPPVNVLTGSEVYCPSGTYNPLKQACVDQSNNTVSVPRTPTTDSLTFGSFSSIADSAKGYYGYSTAAGPDGGNKACAWAVNNVLAGAGIAAIDGSSVAEMERQLKTGRGTAVSTAQAQAGDIIVWKSATVSHVGFCQNAGCTTAISNSSSGASFTNVTNSTFLGTEGRIYRVNN